MNRQQQAGSTATTIRPRCACVTGANRGIGYELVRRLLRLRWSVILACRSPTKGEAAKETLASEFSGDDSAIRNRIHVVRIDLEETDASQLRSAVEEIQVVTNGCGLDVLIHNAAYITYEEISYETVHRSFDINYRGTVRVNEALMPIVKRPEGRVIFVSSAVGKTYLVPDATQAQLLSENLTKENLSRIVQNLENDVRSGRYQEPKNHLGGLAYGLGKCAGTTIYPRILARRHYTSPEQVFVASCCPAVGGPDTPLFLATAPLDDIKEGHGGFWEQRQLTNPRDWSAGMNL